MAVGTPEVDPRLAEMRYSSKTQSEGKLIEVLEKQGYNQFEVTERPAADPPADPPETPAGEGEQPPPDGEAPPEGEQPPAAGAPPAEPPAARPKESGSAKYKRQRDEARARQQELEAEVARYKAGGQPAAPAPAAAPAAPPAADVEPTVKPFDKPKPTIAQFLESEDANGDLIEAMADWKMDKRDHERAEAKRVEDWKTDQRTKTERAAVDAVNSKMENWRNEGRSKYGDDFDKVALRSDIPNLINDALAAAVVDSERSHDLAMWLGQNPDRAKELSAQTQAPKGATQDEVARIQRKAIRLIGAVEAGLPPASDGNDEEDQPEEDETPAAPAGTPPAAAAPPPARQQQAQPPHAAPPKKPTPPTPVRGRSNSGSGQKRISEMTADELRKLNGDDYRKLVEKGLY